MQMIKKCRPSSQTGRERSPTADRRKADHRASGFITELGAAAVVDDDIGVERTRHHLAFGKNEISTLPSLLIKNIGDFFTGETVVSGRSRQTPPPNRRLSIRCACCS